MLSDIIDLSDFNPNNSPVDSNLNHSPIDSNKNISTKLESLKSNTKVNIPNNTKLKYLDYNEKFLNNRKFQRNIKLKNIYEATWHKIVSANILDDNKFKTSEDIYLYGQQKLKAALFEGDISTSEYFLLLNKMKGEYNTELYKMITTKYNYPLKNKVIIDNSRYNIVSKKSIEEYINWVMNFNSTVGTNEIKTPYDWKIKRRRSLEEELKDLL